MIRIGIVGLGFGERVHIPAFRKTGRFEVAAVSSKTPGKPADAARRLGIPAHYDDWRDLVNDPSIQAVAIATPPADQVTIALEAMKKGKAVFLEKPVAMTTDQAARVAGEARSRGVAAMVDFEFCEIPEWISARQSAQSKVIGVLKHVSVTWHLETYANKNNLSSWKLRTRDGGGAVYQFAPHAFHYLEWFGGPLSSISARIGEASVLGEAMYESGVDASFSIRTDLPFGSGHRVELCGSEGAIVLDNVTPDPIRGFTLNLKTRAGKNETTGPSVPPGDEECQDGRIAAVSSMAWRFADWIETGRASSPSAEEGARVQALIEAALLSDKEGRRVDCRLKS